jgi:hypothetical protein
LRYFCDISAIVAGHGKIQFVIYFEIFYRFQFAISATCDIDFQNIFHSIFFKVASRTFEILDFVIYFEIFYRFQKGYNFEFIYFFIFSSNFQNILKFYFFKNV